MKIGARSVNKQVSGLLRVANKEKSEIHFFSGSGQLRVRLFILLVIDLVSDVRGRVAWGVAWGAAWGLTQ